MLAILFLHGWLEFFIYRNRVSLQQSQAQNQDLTRNPVSWLIMIPIMMPMIPIVLRLCLIFCRFIVSDIR
jgi:hypothetical protein